MSIIYANVYDPKNSFFKDCRNDRAQVQTIECRAQQCSMREAGQCVLRNILCKTCPSGTWSVEHGPTKRAASYSKWIAQKKEQYGGYGTVDYVPTKLGFMDGHVYLPYPHMDMNTKVPFLRHSSFFISGIAFIPLTAWTVETVESIVSFNPYGLGGVIESYQKQQVPLFLAHLRELAPAMYSALLEKCPSVIAKYGLDNPTRVGRTALLWTMPPCEVGPYDAKYPVIWKWDGKEMTTESKDAYGGTWGHCKADSVKVTIIPSKDATVVITNDAQVNEHTKFVD